MDFQIPKLTTKQIVFLSVVGVIILVIALLFFGAIPGKRTGAPEITTINVWGIDDEKVWNGVGGAFSNVYKTTAINYRQIDEVSYEQDLVNALAAGAGPDVFMFDNNWLLKHQSKISPIADEKMSLTTLQGLFPQAVEQDFILNGRIYALPVSLDTLVLVYNRDLFDQSSVVSPPKSWSELEEVGVKLRRMTEGELTRAAAGIGGFSPYTSNAGDLVELFLLQGGLDMVDSKLRNTLFNKPAGRTAFLNYLDFSNPESSEYIWDNKLGLDQQLFSRRELPIMFLYSSQLDNLRAKNPILDIGIGEMPQIDSTAPINVADYWGLAVSSTSLNKELAWDFVVYATTNQDAADYYHQRTDRPPALRFLIEELVDSEEPIGIFARQALSARSWLHPAGDEPEAAFSQAVKDFLEEEFTHQQALSKASSRIIDLLRSE